METDGLAHLIGLTALVEHEGVQATGTVATIDADGVTITCDEMGMEGMDSASIVISVFAPDALYRMSGGALVKGLDVIAGPAVQLDRIQRRRWPRRRLDLPVTLCPVVDGRRVEGVSGRTVDVGVGGLCVETLREVPGEGDPMIILSLPDGTSVVALTSTVAAENLGDGWRYRLAFSDLDGHDAGRIASVVS